MRNTFGTRREARENSLESTWIAKHTKGSRWMTGDYVHIFHKYSTISVGKYSSCFVACSTFDVASRGQDKRVMSAAV